MLIRQQNTFLGNRCFTVFRRRLLSSPEYKCIHVSSGIQHFPGYMKLIPGYTYLGISKISKLHVYSRVHDVLYYNNQMKWNQMKTSIHRGACGNQAFLPTNCQTCRWILFQAHSIIIQIQKQGINSIDFEIQLITSCATKYCAGFTSNIFPINL